MSLTVLVVAIIIFFANIGNFPLRNWDEAWYAEIIKNMASGTYSLLVPFWNGHYYFDKPPLYFWLSLPFFKFFGQVEWVARIVSAIAAIFAAFLVYLIAKRLFGKVAGFFSFIVFISLGQIAIRFSHGNLDALLVSLFLAGFYFFIISFNRKIFTLLAGFFIGLGFLVKGWFLGLFPVVINAIYFWAVQKKLKINLVLIIIFSLIFSGWWYILGAITFGKPFVNWYIFHPTGAVKTGLAYFSFEYFYYVLRDIGFWLIPILLWYKVRKNFKSNEKKILLSIVCSTLIFIFSLNFLQEKLDWYLLPAYPLIALLTGYIVAQEFKLLPKVTIAGVIIILIAQISGVNRIENIYPDRSKIGAVLGKHAQGLIAEGDTVVLDDHDFTAFLYYSNHKVVYIVSGEGGKRGEWWVLKYDDLPTFVKRNSNTWIITPNLKNLLLDEEKIQIVDNFNGYYFAKIPK